MNLTRISEVEDALVALLKSKLDVRDIAALTEGDFNEDDQIVTSTPAIRIFFRSEQLDRRTDNTALTYQSGQSWMVLCGAQNVRDFQTERQGAQDLVSRAMDALAGARPALPSQTQGPQMVLVSVSLFQVSSEGTWYALECVLESIVQFRANAS